MNEQVQSDIGFADSELEGYERSKRDLVVRVQCWNATRASVTFRDVIAVRDVMAGDFSGLVRQERKSLEFLQQAIAADPGAASSSPPYQVFSFLNNDDQPSLEIVAVACDVVNVG